MELLSLPPPIMIYSVKNNLPGDVCLGLPARPWLQNLVCLATPDNPAPVFSSNCFAYLMPCCQPCVFYFVIVALPPRGPGPADVCMHCIGLPAWPRLSVACTYLLCCIAIAGDTPIQHSFPNMTSPQRTPPYKLLELLAKLLLYFHVPVHSRLTYPPHPVGGRYS